MRTLTLTLALLVSSVALAKPWNGVEPGVTTKDEVIKKFGTPSRSVPTGDKEVLAYIDKEAIKGTKQVQFKIATETGVVERIDVFPGPIVDKDAVESSFGPACASSGAATSPCYTKKITDDFQTYFIYPALGMVVFFKEDGKTVASFAYQPVKPDAPAKSESTKSRSAKGSRASQQQ
jgi:hypothetical protein